MHREARHPWDFARRLAARARPTILLNARPASATVLPFADQAFDVVVSQQMLQFVPQPAAALREMRRVRRLLTAAGFPRRARAHSASRPSCGPYLSAGATSVSR